MDWFALRWPDGVDPRGLLPAVDPSEWVDMPYGGYHHPHAIRWGEVSVYHGGEAAGGPLVVLRGKGCREIEGRWLRELRAGRAVLGVSLSQVLESTNGDACLLPQVPAGFIGARTEEGGSTASARLPDWPAAAADEPTAAERRALALIWYAWAVRLVGGDVVVTRWDVARLDRRGLLCPRRMEVEWDAGRAPSRWQDGTLHKKTRGGGRRRGLTFTIGSRWADSQFTVYDDGAAHGGAPAGEVYRDEFRAHDKLATALLHEWVKRGPDSLGALVVGLIRQRLRFVDGSRTRGHRSPDAAWWVEWCGESASFELGASPRLPTLEEIEANLDHQHGCDIALILDHYGGDLAPLIGMAVRGRARWKPRHLAIRAAAA